MAALRHGVHTVIIPADNEKDLSQIDPVVRRSLNFITARTVDTVLSAALNPPAGSVAPALLAPIPEDVTGKVRQPGLRQ